MRPILAALSLLVAAAASAAEPPRPIPAKDVPADLAPAVARAEAVMDTLRERLFKRLNELLVQGGPAVAIEVCPKDAPRLARELGEENKLALGRTSFRLRNPANAPRPWAAAHVAASAGKTASETSTVVFDLGDRLGVLRPIGVMPMCTRCHGREESIDPEVRAELARRYPKDEATGFVPGDLRGFMWAEVKKR